MKKIINTFKYGDKKVKKSLALAILAGGATLGFGVFALVLSNMLCFFVAIVAAFVTISLIQTFMIVESENPTVVTPSIDAGVGESVPMESGASKKKKTRVNTNKPKAVKSNNSNVTKPEYIEEPKTEKSGQVVSMTTVETDVTVEVEDVVQQEVKKKKEKKKKEKKNKEKINKHKTEKRNKEQSDSSELKSEKDDEKGKRRFKEITEETASTYTKKKIKKTLHKYKVIKDHRMVIVDRCDKLHIYQTPAYVWIQENQFHILLIEEEPRLLMVPLFRITEISYLKKQPANEEKDYKLFKKNTILTETFRPYLPDYNHSNKTTDLTTYKNLYGITQGIYFTNNSAKNLFELLGVDFYVEDKVTTSNKVNIFFKEAYKANIKLRDNILDANGYADSITKILDDMAHSTISYPEFKDTLNLMIRNKLITDEYANHYMDVRNGLSG